MEDETQKRKEIFSTTNDQDIFDKKVANTFKGSDSSKNPPTATVTSSSSSTSSLPATQPYRNRFDHIGNYHIKHETNTAVPMKSTGNRFDSKPSAVELSDAQGTYSSEEEKIEECNRLMRKYLNAEPSDGAKRLEELNRQHSCVVKKQKEIDEQRKRKLFNDIIKSLEDENETMPNGYDDNERNTSNAHSRNTSSSSVETPRIETNTRVESVNNQFDAIRPIQSRFNNVPNVHSSPNAERFEQRPNYPNNRQITAVHMDSPNEVPSESHYDQLSPESPEQISLPKTANATAPPPIRLAYSGKFARRPRNSSGPSTPDLSNSPITDPWAKSTAAAPAPPQDPRLRNRPPTSNQSTTEQFLPPYRNQQALHPTLSQMPIASNVHAFMHPNIDPYHPAPPPTVNLQQFPLGNESASFHAHSGRPQVHHQSNHFTAPGYNANARIHVNNPFRSPPHTEPYPNSNPNMPIDPRHHQQNQHYQPHQLQQGKETYREHRLRKEKEEEEERRTQAAAAAAAQVSSSTTAATDDKTDDQQSNQDSGANKHKPKDTTEPISNKAYRGNNWGELSKNKTNSNAFKIPKLNKPNTPQNIGKSQTVPTSAKDIDRSSPVETNVSTTSNGKDSQSHKKGNEHATKKNTNDFTSTATTKRKDSTSKKSTDKKKKNRSSLDDATQSDDMISADTTIHVDSEYQRDEQSIASAQSTQQSSGEATNPENVDDILEALKKTVPEDQLKKILSILKPDNNANDNAVTSSTVPPVPIAIETETVNNKAGEKVTTAPAKPKKTTKHANELERLNADIRDNIPDVLRAIGPRACTLNAAKMMDTSPRKNTAAKRTTNRRASTGHKSDDETHSDIGNFIKSFFYRIWV